MISGMAGDANRSPTNSGGGKIFTETFNIKG
jgi:hypothetical protein